MKKNLLFTILGALALTGFSIELNGQIYCTPGYSVACSSGDFINNFSTTLGTTNITNLNSGCNGLPNNYIDYSATQYVSCSPGNTFNFNVQAGSSWSQGFGIWIDYNNNGSFLDPGEFVWNSGTSSTSAFIGSITVPISASGVVRMRVRCEFAGVPLDPCATLSFGETEDYGVVLCAVPADPTVTSPVSACVNNTITLSASSINPMDWFNMPNFSSPVGSGTTYTTPVLTTPGNDTFWVAATNGGCYSNLVPIVVNVVSAAVVALGADTSICGTSYTLDAGNVGSTYLWSNGGGNQTLVVTQSGNYSVTVQTPLGCLGSDAITITFNPVPTVSLGADTNSCSSSITLNAGSGYSGYSWTTGDITQTTTVSASGPVAVTVTDGNGCTANDTIIVTMSPAPVVNLGPDLVQCGGSVTLDAQNPGSLYFWSNNSSSQTTAISSSGNYSVFVITPAGCSNSDTVNITINPQPYVNLGPDTSICGNSITLNAGNPGSTFLWSNNATTQTTSVGSGTYNVTVSNSFGCSDADTIVITSTPAPNISAGSNVSICIGNSTTLAATGGLNYFWSNGDLTATTVVSPTITTVYYVTGYDNNGCSASATVQVTVLPLSNALFTSNIIGATATFTNQSTNAVSYSWNFGDASSGSTSANPSHTYTANGTYTVTLTVTGPCGSDTYTMTVVITQVGLQDNDLSQTLSLFPNPNDGNFTLSFEFATEKNVIVDVFDVSGRVIYNDQENNIRTYNKQIGIENAESGMYFVRIMTTDGVVTQKVLIQR
ncbi:hypothetical protein BH09BAC5_BH09BAC5_01020 [soil metagenome]